MFSQSLYGPDREDCKKRSGSATPDRPKKARTGSSVDSDTGGRTHTNSEVVPEWRLPGGTKYLDLFDTKMPALKGWPVLLDTRIPKQQNRSRKAPMCVKFQVTGQCRQECSLAHVIASDMPDDARSKADALFRDVYKL